MEVASRYRLLPAEGGSAPRVGFELAAYDRTRPLVIDPVLVYSTYLGGSGFDAGNSLAVDPAGNAYVTGETASRDFPRERHFGPQVSADVFIAKLDPSGSQLLYSTVLGGAYSDSGSSIAVDRQGEAYMTGQTFSSDFPFGTGRPAGSPPPPPVPVLQYGGGFVVKLDASGSAIVFARILHAADEPSVGTDIAVDSQGRAFVIETSGFEHRTSLLVLESNGAVASFSAGLSTGCPDPIGPDFLTVLAVDPADNLYLAGYTNQHNAFASKLTSAGALVYATCLAGSRADLAEAIAADAAGNAYVTGTTASSDFPTVHPLQPASGGGEDVFVAKLSPTGAIVYSTYLGGNDEEAGLGIGADGQGNAYVTGYTGSANFPLQRSLPFRCQPGRGCPVRSSPRSTPSAPGSSTRPSSATTPRPSRPTLFSASSAVSPSPSTGWATPI